MEATEKYDLIQDISFVYDQSKASKLSLDFFEKTDPNLERIASYFRVTRPEALLLSVLFVMNLEGDCVESDDLTSHFDCNSAVLLEYNNYLLEMAARGILRQTHKKYNRSPLIKYEYIITDYIFDAIIKKNPLPEVRPVRYTDIVSFLKKVYELGLERDEKIICTMGLFNEMDDLIADHIELPLVAYLKNLDLWPADMFALLYLFQKTINGSEKSDLNRIALALFDSDMTKINFVQEFLTDQNELVRNGWVHVEEAAFFNDVELKLTQQSLELLKLENIKLFSKVKQNANIICPEKIGLKTLYYNLAERRQVEMLENLLKDENLLALQKRLDEKVMPNGITVLLHGAPGTGKTESVLQLAKQTGRELMRVDISQSKSMWFGESEKKIKKIFTNYYEFAKQTERSPILMFNEADAILSKRRDNDRANIAQTENAMQNIILEELENFKGILFATTNLVHNLDKAFERRFLFKVEYFKPSPEIRSKIWKSKLSFATIKECKALAKQFEFSGGQIDNIVRKCEMFEVLSGKRPGLKAIFEFCNEELLSRENRIPIGFLGVS